MKYWYLSATLHGVTTQKAVHVQTIVRFTVPTAVAVVWDVITVQLEDAVASKCQYIFVKLHGVTSHETVIPKDHWFINYKSFSRNYKCISVCVCVCVCLFVFGSKIFYVIYFRNTKSNMKQQWGQVLLFVVLIQEKKYCTRI